MTLSKSRWKPLLASDLSCPGFVAVRPKRLLENSLAHSIRLGGSRFVVGNYQLSEFTALCRIAVDGAIGLHFVYVKTVAAI